jgi:flagellar motor switch protein FliN/FliY
MSVLEQNDIEALLASANALADETQDSGQQARSASPAASGRGAPRQPVRIDPAELRRILHLQFPIIVTLADRRLPFADLLKLTPGSIIEFDRASDAEPDLSIGNRKIGRGHAVKVGEFFGLRITQIDPVEDRIRALGE